MKFSKKLKYHSFFKTLIGISFSLSFCIMLLVVCYPFAKLSLPEKIVPLDGEWKISLEDSEEFSNPEYDDALWDSINLPGKIIDYASKESNSFKGICWIRKSFDISDTENLGLLLGRIANADEAYVNGVRVGSTGSFPPDEFARWNFTRNYIIPNGVLNKTKNNVVAVRISYNQFGEVLGYLSITSKSDCIKYGKVVNFFQVTTGFMAIAVGISLFMLFFVFFYKKPGAEEYFYYCIQLVTGLPMVLEICVGWNIYPDQVFRSKILGISWTAVNVVHIIFLHRIYKLKRVKIEIFLWSLLAIIVLAIVILGSEEHLRNRAFWMILSIWSVGFYTISTHISALVKKRPDAKIFSFFGIALVFISMHDGLIYLIKFSPYNFEFMNTWMSVMIVHFGTLVLFTGTSLMLVARFIDISTEIDGLNSTLENYILENSYLSDKLDKTVKKKRKQSETISHKAEEKIKEVINIIEDKFLYDLDRLVLAESVGVHPDNLSKQFKKYTGKKLGDYIYELRINEAATRLRETDENIIDIAFAVGFESLRTFNRVFPKIMGITPDKYRKQNRK